MPPSPSKNHNSSQSLTMYGIPLAVHSSGGRPRYQTEIEASLALPMLSRALYTLVPFIPTHLFAQRSTHLVIPKRSEHPLLAHSLMPRLREGSQESIQGVDEVRPEKGGGSTLSKNVTKKENNHHQRRSNLTNGPIAFKKLVNGPGISIY